MAVIGREAARAPLTSADINDGIVSAADLAATLDLSSKTLTLPSLSTVDINGGTLDGVTIGGASAGAGSFTTLNADGLIKSDNTSNGVRVVKGSAAYYGQLSVDYVSNDVFTYLDSIAGASFNGAIKLRTADNGGSVADRVVISSTGIDVTGTVTADGLDVDGTGTYLLSLNNTSQDARIELSKSGTQYGQVSVGTNEMNLVASGASTDMRFLVNSSERMRIDSSGNVGIGTASPTQKLHILADTPVLMNNAAGTSEGKFDFADSGATLRVHNFFGTGSNITFLTNSNGGAVAERMRIDSSGNLLVGTTTNPDSRKLRVYGISEIDGAGVGLQVFKSSGTKIGGAGQGNYVVSGGPSTGFGIQSESDLVFGSNGTTERMRIDASGNLLVGTTAGVGTGSEGIELRGDFGYINTGRNTTDAAGHHQFFNPNGIVGSITTSGSATSYNTSSDQRLKDNIVDAPSASDDIDAIQVRSFDWKADGSHQKYGMVAQELMTVAPEAVSGDPESDDMMGVDYSKLVPMMLKEIQSLRARVAQLEGA